MDTVKLFQRDQWDFSQGADQFKKALWEKLKNEITKAPQMLEDDDLEWVNAAGVPHPVEKEETDT